jgi:hypothetical protein
LSDLSKISGGFAAPVTTADSFQKRGKYRQHDMYENRPKEKVYTESISILNIF